MIHLRIRRLAVLLAVSALTAACLAACGSSSSTTSKTSTSAASASGNSSRTKLVACLKAHGVTLPTRRPGAGAGANGGPPPGGGSGAPGGAGPYGGGPGFFGGGGGGAGGGGRFSNPKFRAAFQACGGRAFGGGRRRVQFSKTAITKFVACVKQHGYTLPKPNFSGGAIFPASVERNAKFQKAARSCSSLLRPSAPPQGSGAPAPGASGSGGGTATS